MLGMYPPCLATQGTQMGLRDQIESSGRQHARFTDYGPRETLQVLGESSLTGTWLMEARGQSITWVFSEPLGLHSNCVAR